MSTERFFGVNLPTSGLIAVLAILIFSLSVHEAAHAWMANKRGDPTARDLGRITLNPIKHVSLFLTIILPAFLLYTVGIPFGGAKPVPVNFYKLNSPYRDMALVALAGPASNGLLAILFGAVFHGLANVWKVWGRGDLCLTVLAVSIQMNLLLMVFNMLPIPPLDGSRVVNWLLPPPVRPFFRSLDVIGLPLILALFYFYPPLQMWIGKALGHLWDPLFAIVTLGGLW